MILTSAHAPAEDKSEEERDQFYKILGKTCKKMPRYNYILGDFHAKMEKDNFMDNVAGKFSLHEETSGKGILLGKPSYHVPPCHQQHLFSTQECTKRALESTVR